MNNEYTQLPGLPLARHERCGCIVDREYVLIHEAWHREIEPAPPNMNADERPVLL